MVAAIENTLKHLNRNFQIDQVAEWLNTADDSGYCLLHYIVALDFDESIRLLKANGADIDVKVKDSHISALVIATARGNEQTSRTLVQLGAQLNKAVSIKVNPT